jgi:DNA topoisomerase IB
MTSFEVGFIKYAEECGLSDERIAHILKRAADYPEVSNLFKQLPEAGEESAEQLDEMNNLMQQDLVDRQMSEDAQKLKMQ